MGSLVGAKNCPWRVALLTEVNVDALKSFLISWANPNLSWAAQYFNYGL